MKNVLQYLQEEYNKHIHFSKYPQDNPIFKKLTDHQLSAPEEPTIETLVHSSENHKKLAAEFAKAIEILKNNKE